MKNDVVSIAELEFVAEAVKASVRVDGRGLGDTRKTNIIFRRTDGCVEVTVGMTRAIASVQVEPVVPYPDRPSEGIVNFSVEFSPAASEKFAFEYGAMGSAVGSAEETILLTREIERSIRDSRALDTESLCILAGKLVWSLRIDVVIVDYCGNATDAAEIAAVAALKHANRPDVTISGTEVTIHPVAYREPVPIPIHHNPIATTFALFDNGAAALIDPTLQEELAMDGKITIVMNSHGEICGVHKAGGVCIELGFLMQLIKMAGKRSKAVTKLLKEVSADTSIRVEEEEKIMADSTTSINKLNIVGPYKGDSTTIEAEITMRDDEMMDSGNSLQPPPPADDPYKGLDSKNRPPAPPPTTPMAIDAPSSRNIPTASGQGSNQTERTESNAPQKFSESSNEESDSDEDLMAAVISRPRGGAARKGGPKK